MTTNPEILAAVRNLAARAWGAPVQDLTEVVPGRTWTCNTPGHGGEIAAFAASIVPAWATKTAGGSARAPFGAVLVAFEEDTDWVILAHHDREHRRALFARKPHDPATNQPFPTVEAWESWAESFYRLLVDRGYVTDYPQQSSLI